MSFYNLNKIRTAKIDELSIYERELPLLERQGHKNACLIQSFKYGWDKDNSSTELNFRTYNNHNDTLFVGDESGTVKANPTTNSTGKKYFEIFVEHENINQRDAFGIGIGISDTGASFDSFLVVDPSSPIPCLENHIMLLILPLENETQASLSVALDGVYERLSVVLPLQVMVPILNEHVTFSVIVDFEDRNITFYVGGTVITAYSFNYLTNIPDFRPTATFMRNPFRGGDLR